MDGLFTPRAARIDPRFELRIVGGTAVVVQKGEQWMESPPAAKAPTPAPPAGGAASSPAHPVGGGASSSGAKAPKSYAPSPHSLEERYALCRSVGEECIQEEELRALLKIKPNPVCYDGFEPSGRMHIAQGILKAILVNRLTVAVSAQTARGFCLGGAADVTLRLHRAASSSSGSRTGLHCECKGRAGGGREQSHPVPLAASTTKWAGT